MMELNSSRLKVCIKINVRKYKDVISCYKRDESLKLGSKLG